MFQKTCKTSILEGGLGSSIAEDLHLVEMASLVALLQIQELPMLPNSACRMDYLIVWSHSNGERVKVNESSILYKINE